MTESLHVEWKEFWRDDHLRWVSGFANAESSVLVICRNCKGRVIGTSGAAKRLEELPNGISGAKTSVETSQETQVKTPEQILAVLTARPDATLASLAPAIGKSLRAVERATTKLVKEGRLRFVGPRKGGHGEVIG